MKKFFFILATVLTFYFQLFAFNCIAQTPEWLWAKNPSSGQNYGDQAHSVATDVSGNIYVTGFFDNPTISFGSTTLTNIDAGTYDIFLVKYNASGTVLWAKSAGSSGNALTGGRAYSVAVDVSGNAFVIGEFNTPIFPIGSDTLTCKGNFDIFLAKYDTNGNELWAKSAGGTVDDVPYSVAVDASGNAFIAGYFESDTLSFGSDSLTNTGSASDIFLTKYDANGNVLWARKAGGTHLDYGTSVAVDDSGNAYMAGYFADSVLTFGSTDLVNSNPGYYNDIFLVKYDANGTVIWAKSADGTNVSNKFHVAVDVSGNAYLTGSFVTPNITFGSFTLTNVNATGSEDIFLAKYDINGNVLWAKSAGGHAPDESFSVAVDISGNSYVAGGFYSDTISFDSITLTKVSTIYGDIFLAKYDSNGNVLWTKNAGGTDDQSATSIAVDT
jgi:hypothetical protein